MSEHSFSFLFLNCLALSMYVLETFNCFSCTLSMMFWLQLKFTMFESKESQIYHQNLLFIKLLISRELFPLPI
jgi:hypothetical protein